MATNHEELLDTIGNMTVLELSEFVDAFKEKFNVTGDGRSGGRCRRLRRPRPRRPRRRTSSTSCSRASATRRSRSSRWCASSPAWASRKPRTWSTARPSTVKEAASKADAEAMKAKLEEVGATVVLK